MAAHSKSDRADTNARKALIEAAIEEFSRKGYAAATLAGIARRTGVTTGAVYAHFDSKLDLLLEALGLRTASRFMDVAVNAAKEPVDALTETLAKGLLDASLGRRGFILLDVIVFARRNPQVAKALANMVATRQQAFERMTALAAESGAIDPALPHDELGRLMIAVTFGTIVQRALGESPPSTRTVAYLASQLLDPAPDAARGTDPLLVRVRARAASVARAQSQLRDAVVAAVGAGNSLRAVAQAAGLSHERIRVMLADHEGLN